MKKMIALLLSLFAVQTALAELPVVTEKLDLEAAKNFAVDRLEGGYSLITVQNGGRFLLIPAGMDAPVWMRTSCCCTCRLTTCSWLPPRRWH